MIEMSDSNKYTKWVPKELQDLTGTCDCTELCFCVEGKCTDCPIQEVFNDYAKLLGQDENIKNERHVKTNILLCPECNGTGLTECHLNAYESTKKVCPYCDGERCIQEIITHRKLSGQSTEEDLNG